MAATVYRLKDKTRVPGASTISKMIEESGGLLHWAWQLGLDGKDLNESREGAASPGSLAHAMVQAVFHRTDPQRVLDGQPEEFAKPAALAFTAFSEWFGQTKLEPTASEVSLVSERHRFGGTLDAILTDPTDGVMVLADWKTGSIYPAHLLQVAGYRELWNEHHEASPIERVILVRFSKEDGGFSHRQIPPDTVAYAFEAFLHAKALYEARSFLKKRVG